MKVNVSRYKHNIVLKRRLKLVTAGEKSAHTHELIEKRFRIVFVLQCHSSWIGKMWAQTVNLFLRHRLAAHIVPSNSIYIFIYSSLSVYLTGSVHAGIVTSVKHVGWTLTCMFFVNWLELLVIYLLIYLVFIFVEWAHIHKNYKTFEQRKYNMWYEIHQDSPSGVKDKITIKMKKNKKNSVYVSTEGPLLNLGPLFLFLSLFSCTIL